MRREAVILPSLVLALTASVCRAAEPVDPKFSTAIESRAEYDRAVAPVLAKHCARCHNAKQAEGELDLAGLETDMKGTTSGARWAMVVEKLATGEMRPGGSLGRPMQS